MQARLPVRLGGAGLSITSALSYACYAASRLACWQRMRAWLPFFASVDPCTCESSWCRELRDAYEPLRLRHGAIAATYAVYAGELTHYCDGVTVRQRFRPCDLPSAKS